MGQTVVVVTVVFAVSRTISALRANASALETAQVGNAVTTAVGAAAASVPACRIPVLMELASANPIVMGRNAVMTDVGGVAGLADPPKSARVGTVYQVPPARDLPGRDAVTVKSSGTVKGVKYTLSTVLLTNSAAGHLPAHSTTVARMVVKTPLGYTRSPVQTFHETVHFPVSYVLAVSRGLRKALSSRHVPPVVAISM